MNRCLYVFAGWCVLIGLGHLAWSQNPSAQTTAANSDFSLSAVFQHPRSATEDMVVLTNQEELRGEILTETMSLVTPYAALEIPLRQCAGVSRQDAARNKDIVITVKGDQVSGILAVQEVRIRIEDKDEPIRVRMERIQTIALQHSPDEIRPPDDRRKMNVFTMFNGDVLCGQGEAPDALSPDSDTLIQIEPDFGGTVSVHPSTINQIKKDLTPQEAVMELLGEDVVVFETDFGDITLGFLKDKAPGHVKNMISLAEKGFYDGTKFHRVIPRFMIQGGCPYTKSDNVELYGTGDPGYTINAEFNDIKHVRGILSMARAQDPNSAGSQFFICVDKAPYLDGKYTAFGFVVSGLDVADKIVNVPTKYNGSEKSSPVDPVHLKKAYVKKIPKDQVKPEFKG